jgi:hypothetical protein
VQQELIEAYEVKLEDQEVVIKNLYIDKEQLHLDFAEVRKQQEDDTDTEIE